jgi:uncharacterized protein (UPF0264 family)
MLVDTCMKDGKGLLDWIPLGRLNTISDDARSAGLLFALAGGLSLASLGQVARAADVIGVRGAACRGGREGSVDAKLVRRLCKMLRAGPPSLAVVE